MSTVLRRPRGPVSEGRLASPVRDLMAQPLVALALALVDVANGGGGPDNLSVALARLGPG